ncbi:MAG TPA: hypothetical protein VM492_15345, partial [Sumerlaeia bacterium]|nr:hypothetical protein [Sumerlaeia bacterium]
MGNIALWFIDRTGKGKHKRAWARRVYAIDAEALKELQTLREAELVYETADGRRLLVPLECWPTCLPPLVDPEFDPTAQGAISAVEEGAVKGMGPSTPPSDFEMRVNGCFDLAQEVGEKALDIELQKPLVRVRDFGRVDLLFKAFSHWKKVAWNIMEFDNFVEKRYPGEFENRGIAGRQATHRALSLSILGAALKEVASDKREEKKPDFRGKCLNALLRHYVPTALEEGEDEDEIVCRWLDDLLRPRDFD